MKRVLLFVITNLAIIFVLSIVLSLLGVGRILDEQGVGLDMYNLLIFAAVFGFGGSLISLALIQGVVNTFVIVASRVVGHFVDRVVFKTEQGHGPAFFITAIIAQIVFGILASIIVFWFSRQREFRADRGSARLAGREKMIAALDKLRRSVNQPHLPDQMAAFGISGKGASGLKRLFMTHPPLEERIEALRQHR